MNKITLNPSHFYTQRDVGGPLGLLLDTAFCSFLIFVALGMTVFAFLILVANYIVSPLLAFLSKLGPERPV